MKYLYSIEILVFLALAATSCTCGAGNNLSSNQFAACVDPQTWEHFLEAHKGDARAFLAFDLIRDWQEHKVLEIYPIGKNWILVNVPWHEYSECSPRYDYLRSEWQAMQLEDIKRVGCFLPQEILVTVDLSATQWPDRLCVEVPQERVLNVGMIIWHRNLGAFEVMTVMQERANAEPYPIDYHFARPQPGEIALYAGPPERFSIWRTKEETVHLFDIARNNLSPVRFYVNILIGRNDTESALNLAILSLDNKNPDVARSAAIMLLRRTLSPVVQTPEDFMMNTSGEIAKLKNWLKDKDLTHLEDIQKTELLKAGVTIKDFHNVADLRKLIDCIEDDNLTFFQYCGVIEKVISLTQDAPVVYHELFYPGHRKELRAIYIKWLDDNLPVLHWDNEANRFTTKTAIEK